MEWEKRNEKELMKRLTKLSNIANKNLGKQTAKRLFPEVESNKIPLRLSMIDRACLRSAVVSSTPMTCQKNKQFTPDSSRSVSPIKETVSRKQSKTRQPVILPPDRHDFEGEDVNHINESEQSLENRLNKNRTESKSENLNNIISKLSSARMVSAGMQVSNSNLYSIDKTVQTSNNSVKRIRGSKKLARSICSGKERQTQTGVSLVRHINQSPASSSSLSSNSSACTQILNGAEKAALWSYQCGFGQHKFVNKVKDNFEPDVPGPWRVASVLQKPVEQNPNSFTPMILDSMEDDMEDDDTFLPKPAVEKKVYPNKKKACGKMAVKKPFNTTWEKVQSKSHSRNIDSKKKMKQNKKSIQKSPIRPHDFHPGDSGSSVDLTANDSIQDNREINTNDSYKKQKNTKKKNGLTYSGDSRQDIANFTLDVQDANTKNDLNKSKGKPSCKKTITNEKNKSHLNESLRVEDLALHQSEQVERLKNNNKISPKRMKEKSDKKTVGTSDSPKIIADTDLPKSKCIASRKLRKNGLSKIHDSMTVETVAAQDDSREDSAEFTLELQKRSIFKQLLKVQVQDITLYPSEQFEGLKRNKISPKRMQEKSDKKTVGTSDTDLSKSKNIESAKLRKNGLSKIHDSLTAKTAVAQDEDILEDFPRNEQSVASESPQNEVSLQCSDRVKRRHEKELHQSKSVLDPENNSKIWRGNRNHSNATLENTKCGEEVHAAANILQRLRSRDEMTPLHTTATSQKPGEDLLTDRESNRKTPQRDQNHKNHSLQNTKCSEVNATTGTPQGGLQGEKGRPLKTTDTSGQQKENLLKDPQGAQNHINHSLHNTNCSEVHATTGTPQRTLLEKNGSPKKTTDTSEKQKITHAAANTARSGKKVRTVKTTNTSKTPKQGLLNGLVQNTRNELSDDVFKVPLSTDKTLKKKKPGRPRRTQNTSDESCQAVKGPTSQNVPWETSNDPSSEESQTVRRSSRVRRQAPIHAAGFFIQKDLAKILLNSNKRITLKDLASSIRTTRTTTTSSPSSSSSSSIRTTTSPSSSTNTVNNFGPIPETENETENETNMNNNESQFFEKAAPLIQHEDPTTSNETNTRVKTNKRLVKTGKIKPTVQEEEPSTSNEASTRVLTNESLEKTVQKGKIKKRCSNKIHARRISNSLAKTLCEDNEILNICDNGNARKVRWLFKNRGFKEINGLSGVSSSSFDGSCTGILKIKGGHEKPRHVTNKYSLSFVVSEGQAHVSVEDKTDDLKQDDTFIIPAGCEYSIKNMQKRKQLKLVFTRIPQ